MRVRWRLRDTKLALVGWWRCVVLCFLATLHRAIAGTQQRRIILQQVLSSTIIIIAA